MTVALYVIVSTSLVVVLSARLRDAQEELARVRQELGERAQAAAREERAAYAQVVALSLACLLAGMAAWYAPQRSSARPAGPGRAGDPAGAGAPGKEGSR